jgi:transposase
MHAPARQAIALRVWAWIQRFNRDGLAGLRDAPRAGRPCRHDETARGMVMALARTRSDPTDLERKAARSSWAAMLRDIATGW